MHGKYVPACMCTGSIIKTDQEESNHVYLLSLPEQRSQPHKHEYLPKMRSRHTFGKYQKLVQNYRKGDLCHVLLFFYTIKW